MLAMEALAEFIGESPAVQAVRDQIRRLLARREPGRRLPSILITGETGTGKGLAARTIHRAGPRAGAPFVDVNCAAIPETLLEAELFGYERGAFTDARRSKPGLFQAAHRGLIFLDEIGLLPEALQAKLLKVLEEQAVRRLGATAVEPVDVWIISATNADLQAAVRQHTFREDLYHRLAVLTLRLPPLRERGRDVLILAERFLARVCADYGIRAKHFARDAEARLLAYSWPGNIRELSNVIERATLLSDDDIVTADVLELQTEPALERVTTSGHSTPRALSLGDAMAEHMLAALHQTGWNISRTAALLGISRNTLRARVERLGLRRVNEDAAAVRPTGRRSRAIPPATAPVPRPVPVPSTIRWEQRRIALLRAILVIPPGVEALSGMSRALDVLVDKVSAFGGRVEHLSPTGLLASFGLETVENAPRRAAHAALAMQKVSDRARRDDPLSPRLRVGIHVAETRIGRGTDSAKIDSEEEREHRDTIEALVELAGADDIVVSPPAVPFLQRRFDLIPGTPTGADGRIYRLTGHERKGFELLGRIGTFVGRRGELELLEKRLNSALAGHGQAVALVGEPGVGKSRLVWEFTRTRGNSVGLVLEGLGAAHGKAAPFLPILDLLRSYFEFHDADTPSQMATRVASAVTELDEELSFCTPALQALLEVPVDDQGWQTLDPSQRRQQTLDALKQLVIRESRRRPVLLILEDLHWIDSETDSLLATLVDAIPAARIMLLVTYRPDYRHSWGGKSFYTQLGVEPLPTESAQELLDTLLGRDLSLQPIKSRLIEWAEGNPFFLEESGRTLVETGVVVGERGLYRLAKSIETVQIPATVEEVLVARVARLPSQEKALLECAAVIGKNIPLSLLKSATGLSEPDMFPRMRQLQDTELLYEAGSFPKVEYKFKHALTLEVTYRTIPPERRRELHGELVEALERISPEDIQQLGYHAYRAERWAQALTYLRQAGTKAAAQAANREAVAYFEQALHALAHMPESRSRTEQALDLRFDLRTVLLPLGEFGAVGQHLREADTLAMGLGDQRRGGLLSVYMTGHYYLMGEHDRALEFGERALKSAESLGDFSLAIAANPYQGQVHYVRGDYRRAATLFRLNVDALFGDRVYQRFGLPQLPSVHSRTCLAWCLAELGEFAEAIAQGEEAMTIADSIDNPLNIIVACSGLGIVLLRRGEAESAVVVLERGLDLIHKWSIPLWFPRVASALGSAYVLAGRASDGLPLLEQAVKKAESMGLMGGHSHLVMSLGDAHFCTGHITRAEEFARRALELARKHNERGNEAWSLRLLGEIASQSDPLIASSVRQFFDRALELAKTLEMRPLVARAQLSLGKLAMQGERAEAHERMSASAALFRDMGMTRWLVESEAMLNRLG